VPPPPVRTSPAPPDREESLAAATADALDLLVVGGGITGAGIALDAATRGYRVALVERDDLASGTSSKSSKLVHGGMRYLATGDLAMVVGGVRERDRLRRLAPHLVRPLGFVVPLDHRRGRIEMKVGLVLYDTIALGRNVRAHRWLDPARVLAAVPGLATGYSHGGYRYYDCQTDDARLTLAIAQEARRHGAAVLNHVEVEELLRTGDRVAGAAVRDRLTGATHELRARWVVSASGVWADRVRGLAPPAPAASIVPAKGVHLAFARDRVPVEQAVIVPSHARDRRHVFVVPWGQQVYVGTTDEPWNGDPDRPDLAGDEADYLLAAVNRAFGTDLTVADAVGAWAGLRPLVTGAAAASRDLSRTHAVTEGPPGLVTIVGGKLTTYRRMAQDAVDLVIAADGDRRPCVTASLPLGAVGPAEAGLAHTIALVADRELDPALAGGLYHRHGDAAGAVLDLCLAHGEAEPLVPGLPYLQGEVRWAVRHELARTLDDVLQRRTRVSLRHAAAGGQAIGWAANVMAEELGWSPDEQARQVDDYLARVGHERGPVPLHTSWRDDASATAS
jgi:glycerol-3-phosphate dehydrogenase